MKKYLAMAAAFMLAASMSLSAFAAESAGAGPGNSSGTSSPSASGSSNNSENSSSSGSSKKSSSRKSSGGSSSGSASSASKSGSASGGASAQAAANAAVTAVYRPAQTVITASGQAVASTVSVAAAPAETKTAFTSVAQVFGVAVTDTFVFSASGIDPVQPVLTALAPGSVPAGSALLVVDALGNLTVVVPVVLPDGTVTATLPAMCQVAVVAVPAVPAA